MKPDWTFQSTAHPKAGRNAAGAPATLKSSVSIHGPPEGRPKHIVKPCKFSFIRFQSTAHPKAGRNSAPSAGAATQAGFNPRPTRRQAETHRARIGVPVAVVSIHGPPEGRPKPRTSRTTARSASFQSTAHPKAGRNGMTLSVLERVCKVSIHGPPEGRPKHTR